MSIELEGDYNGFECPHCHDKWWVRKWDNEYNDPVVGISEVRCPSCNKEFNIEVSLHISSSK